MQVVQRFGHLVEYVFAVPFGQYVFSDQSVEVDIHMFEDEVDVSVIFCFDDFFQFNDVGVAELHQEHYLSVGPLGICGVIECVEVLFQGLGLF